MATLDLMITAAGYAALTNAASTGTDAVTITSVGVTGAPFVVADTLTSVPSELKRMTAVAGEATGPNTLNLVMRDDDEVIYNLAGFGLYLQDGTLFAAWSAAQPLVEKSSLASILITIDVAFTDVDAALVQFGDMSWTNPEATRSRLGVMRFASPAQVLAGILDTIAATPLGVATAIEALLGTVTIALGWKAEKTRTVTGGGMISGGGDLSADRVLSVSEASEAECLAATVGDKALSPRRGKFMIDAAVSALVNGAGAALNTLNELAAALNNDPNFASTILSALSLKAPILSPDFAGHPLSPTPAPEDPAGQIANKNYVDVHVGGLRALMQDERAGDMVFRATQYVPNGAYECNGAAFSRSADARLFDRIGTTYGPGDGSTTANLPDMRGEFPRGWDHGRGVDPDRVFGSSQEDELRSHDHSLPTHSDANTGNNNVEDSDGSGTARIAATGLTGGAETRPRNVAGIWIIWR